MRLVIIGYGYTARAIHKALGNAVEALTVTTRTASNAENLASEGLDAIVFDGQSLSPELTRSLGSATHLIQSAAPGEQGDPLLANHDITAAKHLRWVGYLSTVGVYGDHGGDWVTEDSQTRPTSKRSRMRLAAEKSWQQRQAEIGFQLAIFRLAGIYGPGRSALDKLREGTARRIVKPGQVFNRIHVDDIARVVATAARDEVAGTFNISDDEPGPPQDVITFAANVLETPPPSEIAFEDAELSPMARSFYGENKRTSNAKAKNAFGPMLYPTYREGLASIARKIA